MFDADVSSFCMCIQAENAIDRMDWMDKITGVIASLLNNQVPEQVGRHSSEEHNSSALRVNNLM